MLNIIKELESLRLAPVSPDMDKAADILCREVSFNVHEYSTGLEHNGWVVPYSWYAQKADLFFDGKLVYDGLSHPLGVIGYSRSFSGDVSLADLKEHIASHVDRPEDLVYHCQLYYRLGLQDWGFSIPQRSVNSLSEGIYKVELDTKFDAGTMKVLEYILDGETSEVIVLNAHNCHAGQANDDLSGVAVILELIRRLSQIKHRRYTYKFIIAPEHFGTVFYTAQLSEKEIKDIKYGIFVEAVGNDNRLALQKSFNGDSNIDLAADHYLSKNEIGYESFDMRGLIGNDETVWESPGYEIPTISLSRFPFAEYHSSADTSEIIFENRLKDTVDAVLNILESLEKNVFMHRKFKGLVALSNPKYDLYLDKQTDPSLGVSTDEETLRWNNLMDRIIRYFDGKTSALDVAIRHDLPFPEIIQYIEKFHSKGLIETTSA